MSSVLFNRGILTQTGARKKADDAIRDMDALKKSVSDAALTTAEHTTLIRTLQAQILDLEGKLQNLSQKTPLEKEEDSTEDTPAPAPVPEVKSSKPKQKN